MKKALLSLAVVAIYFSSSFAGGLVQKNLGSCGLGSKWFGDKSSLIMHSIAGTTNSSTATVIVTAESQGRLVVARDSF